MYHRQGSGNGVPAAGGMSDFLKIFGKSSYFKIKKKLLEKMATEGSIVSATHLYRFGDPHLGRDSWFEKP